jgi:hypothetical protein
MTRAAWAMPCARRRHVHDLLCQVPTHHRGQLHPAGHRREGLLRGLYDDLRSAKRFVFLTGLHFMADFSLIRTGKPIDEGATVDRVPR